MGEAPQENEGDMDEMGEASQLNEQEELQLLDDMGMALRLEQTPATPSAEPLQQQAEEEPTERPRSVWL